MKRLDLTEENIRILLEGTAVEREELIHQHLRETAINLSPEELEQRAWHWIREIPSGRELILWIPAVVPGSRAEGVLFTLDPVNPGNLVEVLPHEAEFIDRDPVDTSIQTCVEEIEHEA